MTMTTKLISATRNGMEAAFIAARTCYSEGSPVDMSNSGETPDKEAQYKLLYQCYKSGHLSVFEHINFTFAVEGISRACSHQLVRHRHCTFSQQSQRYVDMSHAQFVEPYEITHNREADSIFSNFLIEAQNTYSKLRELGIAPEDARSILPNATTTNLVVTMNCRELMHICHLRLCSRAQAEIRKLVVQMKAEIVFNEEYNWLKDFLVPQCEVDGYCKEHKCCGRKPKLNAIP